MISYTLVILMSIPGSAGAALSSTVIHGFTTEQACKNAMSKIDPKESLNGSRDVKLVKFCVANQI